MKLTKDWLREAATLSNLYQGDGYYDEVSEIVKKKNIYTAVVSGTAVYDVQIEENDLDIDCFCTCPYEQGGICKHVVAVALNILDANFEEEEAEEVFAHFEETVELTDYRLKDGKNFYQNVFESADDEIKAIFLKGLFEHNESLRKNFLELISNRAKYNVSIDVTTLRKTIFDQLLAIDFATLAEEESTLFENTQKSKQTNFELEELAIEKIEKVLNPYGEQSLEYLEVGSLTNAFMLYLGMFEACFGLPDPEWEAIEILENFEAEAITVCQNWQQTLVEQIADTALEETQIRQCIDLIFDRWQLHNDTETTSDVYYDFKFFEPFLSVILSPETAPYLKELLIKNGLINFQTAQIALHTAEHTLEEDWWLEVAENFAGNDPKIAKQLLKKYHLLNQTDDFYRVAKLTFNLFPDKLSDYLLKYIHPKIDPTFYIELLTFFTKNKQDIEGFKELREYISTESKESFIQENRNAPAFYVKLLATELRFAEILELAKVNQNTWDFNEITRPILNIYPLDVFDLHTKRAIESLTLGIKTDEDYKRICKGLQAIQEIKGIDEQRIEFIKKLKKQFKNRPILLEELTAVGF